MGKIAGGSVTFGRTIKPADYESKVANVTINFSSEDDGAWEALLNQSAAIAHAKAYELLGIKAEPTKLTVKGGKALAAETVTENPPQTETKVETPASGGSAASMEDEPPAGGDAAKDAYAAKKKAEENPALVVDEGDGLGDLLGTTTKPEITDQHLVDAVTRKNAEIKQPTLIREAIFKHLADPSQPGQLKDIPQEKRQSFLDTLNALKGAA